MSEAATKLLEQALGLPANERAQLIQQLMDSLEEPDLLPDDPAFEAELNRRLASVADGTAKLIPWEQARDEMHAELERRRAARAKRD